MKIKQGISLENIMRQQGFADQKRDHMAALLQLWNHRVRRPLSIDERTNSPPTYESYNRWVKIVKDSKVVAPSDNVAGLEAAIAARGLKDERGNEINLTTLVDAGLVRTFGARVAIKASRPEWLRIYHTPWQLVARIDGPETLQFVRNAFVDYSEPEPGTLILSKPHRVDWRSYLQLAGDASSASSQGEIWECWAKANALGFPKIFCDLLTNSARENLVELLSAELRSGFESISFESDCSAVLFEQNFDLSRQLSPRRFLSTRLGQAIELYEFSNRRGYGDLEDGYYHSVCRSLVYLADEVRLSSILSSMPIGYVLVCALRDVATHMPQRIADLLRYPWSTAEGAFSTLVLHPEVRQDDVTRLDLSEEWHQVQAIARNQLVLGDKRNDMATAMVMAAWDEQRSLDADEQTYKSETLPTLEARLSPWRVLAKNQEAAGAVCEVAKKFLKHRLAPAKASILWTLRLVEMFDAYDSSLSDEMIGSILRSYSERAEESSIGLLAEQGLLETMRRVLLRAQNTPHWIRWLRPFDLSQAFADLEEDGEGGNGSDMLDRRTLRRVIEEHEANLIAMSSDAELEACKELATAVVEIECLRRRSSTVYISMLPSARRQAVPDLVLLGSSLGKIYESGDREQGKRMLREDLSLLEKLNLLRGATGCSEFSVAVRESIDDMESEIGSKHAGLMYHLCKCFFELKMWPQLKSYASAAIELLSDRRQDEISLVRAELLYMLLVSLVETNLREVAVAKIRDTSDEAGLDAMNACALGLLYAGEAGGALEMLERILSRHPYHAPALSNLTNVLRALKLWSRTVAAAQDARAKLKERCPPAVIQNEVYAHLQMQNFAQASELMGQVAGSRANEPEFLDLRLRLTVADALAHGLLTNTQEMAALLEQNVAVPEMLQAGELGDSVPANVQAELSEPEREPGESRKSAASPSNDERAPVSAAIFWIFLSDIHFGAGQLGDKAQAAVAEDALVSDIETLGRDFEATADFVFVAGDIAFSADKKQYETAGAFVRRVLGASRVPEEHLYMVPGNHDVNWGAVDRDQELQIGHDRFRADHAQFEKFYDTKALSRYKKKFANYCRFAGSFARSPELKYYKTPVRELVGPRRAGISTA